MSSMVSRRVGFAIHVAMCNQQSPTLQTHIPDLCSRSQAMMMMTLETASTAELATVIEANRNGTSKKCFRVSSIPHQTHELPRSLETLRGPMSPARHTMYQEMLSPKRLVGNSTRKQKNVPQVDKAWGQIFYNLLQNLTTQQMAAIVFPQINYL